MRSVVGGLAIAVLAVLCPGAAWAQSPLDGGDAVAPPPADAPPAANKPTPPPMEEPGAGKLANFVLDRGLWFSSDLGMFLTLGSGFKPSENKAIVSNLEPFVAVKAGYDFNNWLSAEVNLSTGYVSSDAASMAEFNTTYGGQIDHYEIFNMTGQLVFALRPTQRFAIEPTIGGGYSMMSPSLTNAQAVSRGQSGIDANAVGGAPVVAFGANFKYLTLLTDFSAGLSINCFVYLPGHGIKPIFAIAPAGVVRYTF